MSRTVATLVGAAVAGFLLWLAAQFDRGTTGGYWASLGVVAGAGLVLALTQVRGRRGNPRGMLLLAFLPVLVVAGWVLLASQPHGNWFRGHVLNWSGDIGVRDVVRDLATYFGVLAFGIGLVFGLTLEPGFRRRREVVEREPAATPAATQVAAPVAGGYPTEAPVAERDPAATSVVERDTTTTAPVAGDRTTDEPTAVERTHLEEERVAREETVR